MRALKQNSEETSFGLSKLDLASTAWKDPHFQLPNKAEVIAEWLLTRLTKAQEKDTPDPEAWDLLAEIVISSGDRSWLHVLVCRSPIPRILTRLLKSLLDANETTLVAVINASMRCIPSLWRIALPRIPIESQLETLGTFIEVIPKMEVRAPVESLGLLLCTSFRSSQSHMANKKKVRPPAS